MPGTIQVSVLDFKGSQASSICSESVIQVSVGKRKYQTCNRGDFSFPVTTLRESVTISVIDADGNEVSHRGIEIKLIVEKGLWEEIISLKEGGIVHIKLQFLLSEEERNRIRVVRQSALRKQHQELVKGRTRITKSASYSVVNAESASSQALTISGLTSQDSETNRNKRPREATLKNLLQVSESKVESEKKTGSDFVRGRIIPFEADNSYNAKVESNRAELPDINPFSKLPSLLRKVDSEPVLSLWSTAYETEKPKEQSLLEQTSSSVKKMINVFESSLTDKEKKLLRGTISANQSQSAKGGNAAKINILGRVQQRPPYDAQKDKPTNIVDFNTRYDSSGSISHNLNDSRMALAHKGRRNSLMKSKSGADLGSLSVTETLTALQNVHAADETSVSTKRGRESFSSDSKKLRLQQASNDTRRLYCYTQSSRSSATPWIFPDSTRQLCITTGGKKLMDLMERCCTKTGTSQSMNHTSVLEGIKEKSVHGGAANEASDRWKTAGKLTKPKHEKSDDAGKLTGPVGQVIRVAIMVGFATLVLLTRQRKDG